MENWEANVSPIATNGEHGTTFSPHPGIRAVFVRSCRRIKEWPIPVGYVVDHNRIRLRPGVETLERAKTQSASGKCRDALGLYLGSNVVVPISHFEFRSLNAARVVYLVEEKGGCARYRFAYGTLCSEVFIMPTFS
jgi:hypothetical protein